MPKVTSTIRKTHYEILGLPHTANTEHIKRAYRKVQLQYHPDKTRSLPESKQREGEALSKAANVAYEILSDNCSRQIYDESLLPQAKARPYGYGRPSKNPSTASSQSHEPSESSKSEEDLPTAARDPPPAYKYPNSMTVEKEEWRFGIEISKRFVCRCWGPNYVWVDGDSILLLVKLQEQEPRAESIQKDVRIAVGKTPGQRRVIKIESYFKHRTTEAGPETLLWLKLHAPNSAPRNFQQWDFAWDLETSQCSPPAGVANYATNLIFDYGIDSEIRSYPKDQILKDRDLTPRESIVFADLQDEASQTVEYGRNNQMRRQAAFGYSDPNVEAPPPPKEPRKPFWGGPRKPPWGGGQYNPQ